MRIWVAASARYCRASASVSKGLAKKALVKQNRQLLWLKKLRSALDEPGLRAAPLRGLAMQCGVIQRLSEPSGFFCGSLSLDGQQGAAAAVRPTAARIGFFHRLGQPLADD